MAKKHRIAPDVELIPYYEYDPTIHNIEYRYLPQGADGTYTDWEYTTESSDFENEYRQYPYGGYYNRPRRRRRRRRRRPPYGPGFGPGFGYGPGPGIAPIPQPLPLPVPGPAPYPPYYGPYPFL